jgi:lipopolysaccharide export system protein LptA
MKCLERRRPSSLEAPWTTPLATLLAALLLAAAPAHALKSDRQQPLDARADATSGTLGDGTATFRGNVEIHQGTLLIRADLATVEKLGGRVQRIELSGDPVHLQQEIEEEGLVTAEARTVEYEVASGIVTLSGAADVDHPQYQISGEVLRYDLNAQHFQGSGGDQDGRIRIRLDPEMFPGDAPAEPQTGLESGPQTETEPESESESESETETETGPEINPDAATEDATAGEGSG